ncbi:MAG: HlyD family type I secretion periplasmic adaptor subunit [Sideroxydans sp.]|nr:HlyD family type I secretion periplasmic adaptor subunit [Sideroxydans sp.]
MKNKLTDFLMRIRAVLQRFIYWMLPMLEKARVAAQPQLDKTVDRWISKDDEDVRDFVADSDWVRLQQEPLKARSFLRVTLVIVVVLLLWASLSSVDEITRGDGKVIPSRQLQVIQSLDGGIVSEILAKEGQVVDAGQVLLRVDQTRAMSSLREGQSNYLSLLAKAARLTALSDGVAYVPPAEVVKDAPDLAEAERALYQSKRNELQANVSIAQQQLAQRTQELNETRARRDQAANSLSLVSRELEMTRPLLSSGAVSDVDLLKLEREVSNLRGERDGMTAQMARLNAAIGEAQRKIQQVELDFRNQAGSELSDTKAKLGGLSESNVGLSDKVSQTVIKSPMRGTVKRIMANTVGGVVQPGKDIVEIVPLEDDLLIEARVLPRDIAALRPGQKALVRFTAFDFAIYGGLQGTLEQIGADTVVDEKGNAFYIIRVRTARPDFGPDKPIIPGMTADVDVMTGSKTILSYLLKPILRANAYALTER